MSGDPAPFSRSFNTRDAEEARAYLRSQGFRLEIPAHEARFTDTVIDGVSLPGLYLGYLQYGAASEIRADPSRDDYRILPPIQGSLEAVIGDDEVSSRPGHAILTSPTLSKLVRSERGSGWLNIFLRGPALRRHLAALLGEPPKLPLEFAPVIDLAAGYGRSLMHYVLSAMADLDQNARLMNPITTSLFEQFVMVGLLHAHPHNYTARLYRPQPRIAPRDVKRAIDYIEANLDMTIGLPEIVAACGVPGRTLIQHFRDFKRTSPVRYLRTARYEKVRGVAASRSRGEHHRDRRQMGLQPYGPVRGRISQTVWRTPLTDIATRAQCAGAINGTTLIRADTRLCWTNVHARMPAAGSRNGWCAKWFLIVLPLALGIAPAQAQPIAETQPYTEVFYSSGLLRIQAYLYRPSGNGPFPLVIYNHGSRESKERESWPFSYVGRVLLQSGYAVLVPERRGYGRSDGPTFTDEMRQSIGRHGPAVESPLFVGRLQAESDDVLAALDFIRTLSFVDQSRLGIMGWSFGGVVTMFVISRSGAFRAAVDQAGGALTWDGSAALREALLAAARQARPPVLLMVAQNDRTTASITTLAGVLQAHNPTTELIVYPPFIPSRNPRNTAPGHLIFSEQGSSIWENDVRTFFAKYLGDSTSRAIK